MLLVGLRPVSTAEQTWSAQRRRVGYGQKAEAKCITEWTTRFFTVNLNKYIDTHHHARTDITHTYSDHHRHH